MKEKWYVLVIALMIAVFVFAGNIVLAAQKPKTVAELALYKGADRQQILEEGAKKEGKLVFYTTQIVKQTVRPLVNAFQKKYPYIKVEFWRASMSKIIPRVREEFKSGKHIVDVISFTQAGEMVLEELGIIQPFYSPNLVQIEDDALKKAQGGGTFYAGHYISGKGMGYNTELITKDQLPKSYQDLLDPKWKGKLTLAGSNSGVYWMGTLLATYGEDFVRQMAKQNFDVHVVSGRAILDLVIAGEYVFSPTCFDAHVTYSKKMGAPIDWVPLEPAHAILHQIVLPKRLSHPHAALLYIDFDLSKKAAELYKAGGYISPRKDVANQLKYKKYYGPESTKQFMRWTKLFRELFMKQ
ncbi:ABC transporter substrate-binding protein [Thermodesulfobacteriota bacterium]